MKFSREIISRSEFGRIIDIDNGKGFGGFISIRDFELIVFISFDWECRCS